MRYRICSDEEIDGVIARRDQRLVRALRLVTQDRRVLDFIESAHAERAHATVYVTKPQVATLAAYLDDAGIKVMGDFVKSRQTRRADHASSVIAHLIDVVHLRSHSCDQDDGRVSVDLYAWRALVGVAFRGEPSDIPSKLKRYGLPLEKDVHMDPQAIVQQFEYLSAA